MQPQARRRKTLTVAEAGPSRRVHTAPKIFRLLTALAESLKPYLGRPVVDMTGLKGTYQVALDFSLADMSAASKAAGIPEGVATDSGGSPVSLSDPPGNSILSALRRYGLRLEPRKAPLEQLVVDHLEKTPTAN